MTIEQKQVRDWMRSAGQDTPDAPTIPDIKTRQLRIRLIQEELCELDKAMGPLEREVDLVASADALADLMYVVLGTGVALGIDLERVFQEVHKSNNTKLHRSAVGGMPYALKDAYGKIVKPPHYRPPDLSFIKCTA